MAFDAVRKKEQEWRDAVDAKFRASQDALKSRDCQIKQLKEQLETLGADFRYNLALLVDRDADLKRFESSIERLNAELGRKEEVANCMKVKLEEAQIASHRNFFEYEDRRRFTEKIILEKDASITDLKRQLESKSAECSRQLEIERMNNQRRLQDLANEAGRQCSKLKNQYANAISVKDATLKASVAQSDELARCAEERVANLQLQLQASNSSITKLQASLNSVEKQFKETSEDLAKENKARLGAATAETNELASKLEQAVKETADLRLEGDNLRKKLSDVENKVAERDRILNIMGNKNLPFGETVLYKDQEFQQLKKQNHVLRCVIKEMKRKNRINAVENEEEGNLKIDEVGFVENDVDDKRVSQMENAIRLLKKQMFENLRDKLASRENGTGDPKDPNYGEVRILLLEQKLDKATENIGKTVALEKKELLAEMKNVRKEIASKLNSQNLLGNNLIVSKDVLKSDQILESVRKDIMRLESKIGKMNRENDIEVVERMRAERGVGFQSSRRDLVTRHQPMGHRRVDCSSVFYLPLPPTQIQGTATSASTRKVAIQEKKTTHAKIRNYNIRD